jgi:hypothetical protein
VYELATGVSPRLDRRRFRLARPRLERAAFVLAGVRLRLARRALTLATGLAAAVPVIAATVKAVRDGWVPGADQAIIATRAYDVFTSHPPLVGQYTLAGQVTGKVTHSLGPMLFWLLAIPAHFGDAASMTWTMGALNTLSIVGAVALARRRGGLVLMFASGLAIALMCQSLAAETFHDVWNPSAGLFPFTLLIFLCWSLACGEHRLLPLTALVASFAVQTHLMYLPPTAGLLVVALGGLALWVRSHRRSGETDPPAPGRRSLLLWSAAAIAVLALCWSAPVIDELSERPGNMTLVVRSATSHEPTLGASAGWHAVVRAVGVQPWWLHEPSDRWVRKYDVRATPATGAVASCPALLAGLALVLVIGLARRRRDVASGALIGLVLCGTLAAVAASTPTPRLLSATLGYTMWWGSQVGMWVWLVLAWAGWLGVWWLLHALARLRASRRAGERRASRDPAARLPAYAPALVRVVAGILGVLATAAVGSAVAKTEKPDEHAPLYRPAAALAAHLDRAVAPGRTVELLGSLNIATMPIKPALRYFLVRHGVRPLAPGSFLRLGSWYELYGRPYQSVVYVENGIRAPATGLRLLDRVHFTTGWGPEIVSLWIYPHGRAPRVRRARQQAR